MKNVINYDLISERRWTEFLNSLKVGNYTIQMPDNRASRSMKTTAYTINAYGESENVFNFSENKRTRTLTIKVIPRGEARVSRAIQ